MVSHRFSRPIKIDGIWFFYLKAVFLNFRRSVKSISTQELDLESGILRSSQAQAYTRMSRIETQFVEGRKKSSPVYRTQLHALDGSLNNQSYLLVGSSQKAPAFRTVDFTV